MKLLLDFKQVYLSKIKCNTIITISTTKMTIGVVYRASPVLGYLSFPPHLPQNAESSFPSAPQSAHFLDIFIFKLINKKLTFVWWLPNKKPATKLSRSSYASFPA